MCRFGDPSWVDDNADVTCMTGTRPKNHSLTMSRQRGTVADIFYAALAVFSLPIVGVWVDLQPGAQVSAGGVEHRAGVGVTRQCGTVHSKRGQRSSVDTMHPLCGHCVAGDVLCSRLLGLSVWQPSLSCGCVPPPSRQPQAVRPTRPRSRPSLVSGVTLSGCGTRQTAV